MIADDVRTVHTIFPGSYCTSQGTMFCIVFPGEPSLPVLGAGRKPKYAWRVTAKRVETGFFNAEEAPKKKGRGPAPRLETPPTKKEKNV